MASGGGHPSPTARVSLPALGPQMCPLYLLPDPSLAMSALSIVQRKGQSVVVVVVVVVVAMMATAAV